MQIVDFQMQLLYANAIRHEDEICLTNDRKMILRADERTLTRNIPLILTVMGLDLEFSHQLKTVAY